MTNLGQFLSPNRKAPRNSGSKWSRFRKNVFVSFLIDLLVIVGSALVLSLLIKTFLVRSFFVPSGSMLSTLQIDDRIIVNELVPNVVPIERGDVVVFKDPGGWLGTISTKAQTPVEATADWFLSAFGLTAPDSSQHLVKRVIGVGGDHIVCCSADGKLTINGKAITETYLDKGVKPSEVKFDVTVPEGSIWVMGDNRGNSEDSRFHGDLPSKGFVGKQFIVGRAILISWPTSHWTWLDNFANVFKDVPKP
jgi:signal peptidase I